MLSKRYWTRESVEIAFKEAQVDPSAVFLNSFGRRVFRHDGRIIKCGEPVHFQEAEVLFFIAKSGLEIPAPKVYSSEVYEDMTVIEMEMIPGDTLEDVWPKLSMDEKKGYAQQLRQIVNRLRSLEGSYIGSPERRPAVDTRRDTNCGGPFPSETTFNEFLLSNIISSTPRVYRNMLQILLSTTHKIVFTHGDLSMTNIIVREGRIVSLLDWETAGWYPEYWEFVQFFRAAHGEYRDYADIIFDTLYPAELMTDHFLGHLTRH